MFGILLAFLSSFFWATNDLFSKKLIYKGFDEYFILWIRFPLSSLLLLPLSILFWDMNSFVLVSTLIWLPVETLGGVLFIKALKHAPLSIAMSFYSLMPFFSALFSFLLLGEGLTPLGFAGILLTVVGAILITGPSPKDFFRKSIGSLYMIVSTLLFGLNVVIGKMVILESNPYFFSWYYTVCMSAGTFPFVKPEHFLRHESYKEPSLLLIGLFFALGGILYYIALLHAPTSYVVAVERISILLSLYYGKVFFGEEVKHIIPGTLLMLMGSLLLSLSLLS
ncbi:MAG: DMT family transporter [Aquificaceae bacterium]